MEPRDTCLLLCLILASGSAGQLPAHLPDTRRGGRRPPGAACALCSRAGGRRAERAAGDPPGDGPSGRPARRGPASRLSAVGARRQRADCPQVTEAGTEFEGKATTRTGSRECNRLRSTRPLDRKCLLRPSALPPLSLDSIRGCCPGVSLKLHRVHRPPGDPLPTLQSWSPQRGGASPLSARPLTTPQVSRSLTCWGCGQT